MKFTINRTTGALLALFLILAPLAKGQAIDPVIDGDSPRTYTIDSVTDALGFQSTRVNAFNLADVTISQLPASELKLLPTSAVRLPHPVLDSSFRDQLAKIPSLQLQKVAIQFKHSPKIHYLANKTADEGKVLLQQEQAEGAQLQQSVVSWIETHGGKILDQALDGGFLTAVLPAGVIPNLADHPDLSGIYPELLGSTTNNNVARSLTNAGTVYTALPLNQPS